MQLNQFIYENRLLWQTVADPNRSRECRLQWLEHGGYFYLKIGNGNLVHMFWKTEQQSMGYLSIRSYPSCLLRKHLALVVPSVHRLAGHCTMSVRRYICFAICCHLAVVWVWYAIYFQFSSMCEIAEATNGVCAWTTLCRICLESSKSGTWCSWFDVRNVHVHSVRYACGECSVLRLCLLERRGLHWTCKSNSTEGSQHEHHSIDPNS